MLAGWWITHRAAVTQDPMSYDLRCSAPHTCCCSSHSFPLTAQLGSSSRGGSSEDFLYTSSFPGQVNCLSLNPNFTQMWLFLCIKWLFVCKQIAAWVQWVLSCCASVCLWLWGCSAWSGGAPGSSSTLLYGPSKETWCKSCLSFLSCRLLH